MRVLITGSTGFLGSHLCRELVEIGHQVRAFHRPNSSLDLLSGLDLEYVEGDVTQPPSLEAAVQGIDVLFHSATHVRYWRDSNLSYKVTQEGTRNALEAARKAGVQRVVYTSSIASLGVPEPARVVGQPPLQMDENHTWNYRPAWWRYGHAKHLAEMEVQRAVAQGLDVVITNPSIIFGPGDLNQTSGELVLWMARHYMPFSPTGGSNVVHVSDVARGHIYALERGRTGERYILGGVNLTHKRLLETVAQVVGTSPPRWEIPGELVRALAPAFDLLKRLGLSPYNGELPRLLGRSMYYDTSKAERDLGFTWAYSPREMIQESYDWYRERGYLG